MDASKLLNEQMKREARKAIADYVRIEVHSATREEAGRLVSAWMREHKAELRDAVNTEMEKRVRSIVKDGVNAACERISW